MSRKALKKASDETVINRSGVSLGHKRTIVGAVSVVFSAVYSFQVLGLADGNSIFAPGPAQYPAVLAIAFVAIAVATLGSGILMIRQQKQSQLGESPSAIDVPAGFESVEDKVSDESDVDEVGENKVLFLAVSFLVYVIVTPMLGHLVASCAYALVVVRFMGKKSWLRSVMWGLVLGLAVHLLFVTGLGLQLPTGLIRI